MIEGQPIRLLLVPPSTDSHCKKKNSESLFYEIVFIVFVYIKNSNSCLCVSTQILVRRLSLMRINDIPITFVMQVSSQIPKTISLDPYTVDSIFDTCRLSVK